LTATDGATDEVELLADTGNPCALIISQTTMARLKQRAAPGVNSNFGPLEGGWIHVNVPELGLDRDLVGYASDAVALAAESSSPDFAGLAGLPLLRLMEYGGDANWFWLRPGASPP
jgi:hypothetical protein